MGYCAKQCVKLNLLTNMKTEDCRLLIVDWIVAHPNHVYSQFEPTLFWTQKDIDAFEGPAKNPKNWKRMSKRTEGNNIVREFDCKPYDDQLRAIVIENKTTNVVTKVIVQGE